MATRFVTRTNLKQIFTMTAVKRILSICLEFVGQARHDKACAAESLSADSEINSELQPQYRATSTNIAFNERF